MTSLRLFLALFAFFGVAPAAPPAINADAAVAFVSRTYLGLPPFQGVTASAQVRHEETSLTPAHIEVRLTGPVGPFVVYVEVLAARVQFVALHAEPPVPLELLSPRDRNKRIRRVLAVTEELNAWKCESRIRPGARPELLTVRCSDPAFPPDSEHPPRTLVFRTQDGLLLLLGVPGPSPDMFTSADRLTPACSGLATLAADARR